MTTDICKESELYKYLALNDTIHDFGKGSDRGDNIDYIVKGILDKAPYKDYTPFGDNRNITISSFERSVEEFILYNCNLPGIPESILAQSPYLTSPTLGDQEAKDVTYVPIYRFINKNKNVNYGIKLYSYQVLGLTDTQRKNIFEEPSNIDPEISFFSTIIIEDQIPDDTGIRKLFNWTQDELIKDTNITKYLSSTQGVNDIKKNKIGDFFINSFFYAGSGSGYKGFIYNTDAVGGNLRCAFSEFNNNVLGGVKDTTNYGDSAGTEETGGDDDDGTSKNKTVKKCGKNKKTKAENNLFDLVVGFFNVEQKKKGVLSIEVSENPDELPSLFPASNGLPQGRKVYFFSNNLFTEGDFTIAYVENKDKTWKPYFQPYNFSLCVYKGKKTDEFTKTIQENLDDVNILIGQAPFSSGDNGPSVVYLKDLIIAIDRSTDKKSLDININNVFPEGKVLNINEMLQEMYPKTNGTNHLKKKLKLIKFLLDLKRCGDYEQVDAIRMIQDQNEGTNNRFGLQDILFTTGDRLCSLYSRFKKTNVQFFVASTQRYYLYRQPYIYPSNEVRNTIAQQNIFNELKQKAKKAGEFMTKIPDLKDIDLDTYYSDNKDLKYINEQSNSYIKSLCIYIYTLQRNRLKLLQDIQRDPSLQTKINFCEKLRGLSFNDTRDPNSPFYFDVGETILKIKYKDERVPVNCNEVINSFYFLASSEIFSRMRTIKENFLDMKITKEIDIKKVIPEKNTISLLDFLLEGGEITNKLDEYYKNFKLVYDLILTAFGKIKIGGTGRAPKTNVIDYLKYSNIVICFLQVCSLIFGSLDKINEKINNLENVNDTLKPLIIHEFEQKGKRTLETIYTPTVNVDTSPTTPSEQEELFTPSDDIFSSIFNNLKKETTVNAIVLKKEKINKTKQERKKEKQEKQKEKQTAKDEKKKKKMVRAVEKFKELKENTQALKGKEVATRLKDGRIRRERIQRQTMINMGQGGGNTQKGGGIIDTLMGDKMEELYTDVNIIAFMNQIYSNIMPYELLLILLTEFDFEYSGISNTGGEMIPISELPVGIKVTDSDYYPMVLSREEYLLKFQTELSNLISNPKIGLELANKAMLEKVVVDGTDIEQVLIDDSFNIIPSIEQMENRILTKKNISCFLGVMNKDSDSKKLISNYLKDMGKIWLTILYNISISEDKTVNNIFTLPISVASTTEVKRGMENIHLITTLLTITDTDVCKLSNPFEEAAEDEEEEEEGNGGDEEEEEEEGNGGDEEEEEEEEEEDEEEKKRRIEEEAKKTAINNYLAELNKNLDLDEFCKSTGTGTRKSSRNFGDLNVIKNIILRMKQIENVDLQITIIYLISILGAVLFDVTELYFPNKEKEYRKKILNVIHEGRGLSGDEETVGVTNEEIFEKLATIIDNLLVLVSDDSKIQCVDDINSINERNIDDPNSVRITKIDSYGNKDCSKGICVIMGGSRIKSKRNKKKNKRKTVKSKNQIYF